MSAIRRIANATDSTSLPSTSKGTVLAGDKRQYGVSDLCEMRTTCGNSPSRSAFVLSGAMDTGLTKMLFNGGLVPKFVTVRSGCVTCFGRGRRAPKTLPSILVRRWPRT